MAKAKSLVLVIKAADGTESWVVLGAGRKVVPVSAGARYKVVDAETGKEPEGLVVIRSREDLVVQVDGLAVLEVDQFFRVATPDEQAFYEVEGTACSIAGDITEESRPLATIGENHLMYPPEEDCAAAAVVPGGGWLGGWALLGLGLLGAGAAGYVLLTKNDPPVATDDTARTNEDTPVTIPVLANDSDPDNDDLTVISASATNGTVTINPDGTLTYTPTANFNGTATITYTINDGNGNTDTATVTVTVTAVNDAPVAANDSATTAEDTPVSGNVLTNDSDVDGNPLSVASFTVGGTTYAAGTTATLPQGTLVVNANGTYTFTPAANFNGTLPTVTYVTSDGQGASASATLAITVTPVNDPPVAVADTATTNEDTPVTIPVLTNDSDPDGDPLTVTAATAPNGTVTINPDGTVTYTPNPNYAGPTDTITYTITDPSGATSTATVTVTVTPVNDPPVAVADTATTNEDTPVTIPVLTNDSDPDGDPLTVTAATAPNGTVTINPDGTVTYTPNPNYAGPTDTITYTITDPSGATSTATVTVTVVPVNDPPVAVNDILFAPAQKTFPPRAQYGDPVRSNEAHVFNEPGGQVQLLANDTDPEGDSLTIISFTQPLNGTLVQAPDGTMTYAANPGYVGPESFTYTISDGNGGTSTATVNFTVYPEFAAYDDVGSGLEDSPQAGSVTTNDAPITGISTTVLNATVDVDGDGDQDVLSLGVLTTLTDASGTIGTIRLTTTGSYVFTPAANWNGTVPTVTYTAQAIDGPVTDTATLSLTVVPVNDAPIANTVGIGGVAPTTNVGSTYSANLFTPLALFQTGTRFSDVEGDPLTIVSFSYGGVTYNPGDTVTLPEGTLIINADGSFTYTATSFGQGPVNVAVNVSDGLLVATHSVGFDSVASGGTTPPIALDINADGAVTYTTAMFDVDGDGDNDSTAWVGGGDGILFWDKLGDGQLHGSDQYAFAHDGMTDLEGFAALFDSNQDGVFSALDDAFAQFAVWRDDNQNGTVDGGELLSLTDAGIVEIDLTSDGQAFSPALGVHVYGQSEALLVDGSSMLIHDVALGYRPLG
jgi:CshA-type fibril repeat protein